MNELEQISQILELAKKLMVAKGSSDDLMFWLLVREQLSVALEEYQGRECLNLTRIHKGLKVFERLKKNGMNVTKTIILAWLFHGVIQDEIESASFAKTFCIYNSLHEYLSVSDLHALIYHTQHYPHADKLENLTVKLKEAFNMLALAEFEPYFSSKAELNRYIFALKKEMLKRYHWKEKTYLFKRKEFLEHYMTHGYFPTLADEDLTQKIKDGMQNEIEIIKDILLI